MKKKTIILVLIGLLICITGCNNNQNNNQIVGGYQINLSNRQVNLDNDILKIFNDAKSNYTEMDLEPVALLATQVVAGKNYMFLARSNDTASYKIVIVYNDLENKSTLSSVKDFEYTEYTYENISNNDDNLMGGWNVNIPNNIPSLENDIQTIFDDATSKIKDTTYYPIEVLGTQLVSGTNYAILCYRKGNDSIQDSIYLITLYEDLNKTNEIVSEAYIDLKKYNQ